MLIDMQLNEQTHKSKKDDESEEAPRKVNPLDYHRCKTIFVMQGRKHVLDAKKRSERHLNEPRVRTAYKERLLSKDSGRALERQQAQVLLGMQERAS
jgi:hypothetical protein